MHPRERHPCYFPGWPLAQLGLIGSSRGILPTLRWLREARDDGQQHQQQAR